MHLVGNCRPTNVTAELLDNANYEKKKFISVFKTMQMEFIDELERHIIVPKHCKNNCA